MVIWQVWWVNQLVECGGGGIDGCCGGIVGSVVVVIGVMGWDIGILYRYIIEVTFKKTEIQTTTTLGTKRFTRFSEWLPLVKGLSRLITAIRSRRSRNAARPQSQLTTSPVEIRLKAKKSHFDLHYL